jgi:peptide/nickel transport system ATP-binding protein
MEASEPVLQANNLQVAYRYNGRQHSILDNVALELRQGEIVALLGESGSGKSTLAKALSGLLPPSAQISGGTLQIGATPTIELADRNMNWQRIRGRGIAMLFQDAQLALNPLMTIKEHFKESLLFHQLAAADEVTAISGKLLSRLNFTDVARILDSYPFQLSGGMCQRICLALALCLEPKVLIADEPTSALDTVSQREVLQLLQKMQAEFDLSILLITHDISVAGAISNRVIVLNKGAIVEQGNTQTVLAKPTAAYTRQLLAARAPLRERLLPLPAIPGEPLLELKSVSKFYHGNNQVLHRVNLALGRQEILGIAGQSGCGKSTLAKCIVGLEPINAGRISYKGTDISRLQGKRRRELAKSLQLVFQDARASLNPGRTALQLVQEPLDYLRIGERKEREAQAEFYLNEVGITGAAHNRRPPQLSTGQCQRIAIARALVLKPDVLICDEAVSALDMSVQAQILALLQRLHKQYKFAMVMISHDIRVLRSFCHHIAVMERGSFDEAKQTSELLHESKHSYTQFLLRCAGELEEGLLAKGGMTGI